MSMVSACQKNSSDLGKVATGACALPADMQMTPRVAGVHGGSQHEAAHFLSSASVAEPQWVTVMDGGTVRPDESFQWPQASGVANAAHLAPYQQSLLDKRAHPQETEVVRAILEQRQRQLHERTESDSGRPPKPMSRTALKAKLAAHQLQDFDMLSGSSHLPSIGSGQVQHLVDLHGAFCVVSCAALGIWEEVHNSTIYTSTFANAHKSTLHNVWEVLYFAALTQPGTDLQHKQVQCIDTTFAASRRAPLA